MNHIDTNLISAISNVLGATPMPLGADVLYASPTIHAKARSVRHVSTYLNEMWRQGLLTRVLLPSDDMQGFTWSYFRSGGSTVSLADESFTREMRERMFLIQDDSEKT